MTKKSILFPILLILGIMGGLQAQSDSPSAWFVKSTKKQGNALEFSIRGVSNFSIDFGDKKLVSKTLSNTQDFSVIQGNWLGDTIKIYGGQVNGFKIFDSLKAANVNLLTNLTSLSISGCDSGTIINFSKLIALSHLDLHNNGITSIATSTFADCKQLTYLNLSNNKITTFSATALKNCTLLDTVIISNNKINSTSSLFGYQNNMTYLDVSNNKLSTLALTMSSPKIKVLKASNNLISNITNLQKVVYLLYVDFSNNKISDASKINLSAANKIIDIQCQNNELSKLMLGDCENLTHLNISNNKIELNLVRDIKEKIPTDAIFTYAPQAPLQVKGSVYQNDTIDFSAYYQYKNNDSENILTQYKIFKKNSVELVENDDYINFNGKIIFKKNFGSDSVYITMSNAVFPQFSGDNIYKSSCMRVWPPFSLGKLALEMSNMQAKGSPFVIGLTGPIANTQLQVDFGDGNLIEVEVKKGPSGQTLIYGNVQGDTIRVYGNLSSIIVNSQNLIFLHLKEGSKDLFALNCTDNNLKSLDISSATTLKVLQCQNNQLNFASLPAIGENFQQYSYSPQSLAPISKKRLYSKDTLNLDFLALGEMSYTWKTNTKTLEQDLDYSMEENRVIFHTAQTDSLFGEITSSNFPLLSGSNALKTEKFKALGNFVREPLAVEFSTLKPINSNIEFILGGIVSNTLIHLDFGDGVLYEYEIKGGGTSASYTTKISHELMGNTVKIYGKLMVLQLPNLEITNLKLEEGCAKLSVFVCANNKIESINIAAANELKVFQCPNNFLNLATLPAIPSTTTQYAYSPQGLVQLPKIFNTDSTLDLSAHAYCTDKNGAEYTTLFLLKKSNGTILELSNDYTIEDGFITFLKEYDSIFIEFSNGAYPLFNEENTLRSTYFNIEHKIIPPLALTFETKMEQIDTLNFYFNIPISEKENHIWLDFGNGQIEEKIYSGEITKVEYKVLPKGKNIKIYTFVMDSLFIQNNMLSNITFEAGNPLKTLNVTNNELSSLNISKLNSLENLACEKNNLYFNSLPSKINNLKTYTYAPQMPYLVKNTTAKMKAFDIEFLEKNTTVVWKNEDNQTLIMNTDYFMDSNILRFLNFGKVYAELTHPDFPDFTDANIMRTTLIEIRDTTYATEDLVVEATGEWKNNDNFIFLASSTHKYALLQIDRGDGNIKTWHLTDTTTFSISDTVLGASSTLKIYGNNISTLDMNSMKLHSILIQNNDCLKAIDCSKNKLSNINLSASTALETVHLSDNQFAMYNLPEKSPKWMTYTYAPQITYSECKIDNQYKVDLRKFYSLKGVSNQNEIAQYKWVKENGNILAPEIDYTMDQGIFTFLRGQEEKVYCQILTDAFPNFIDNNKYITNVIDIKIIGVEHSKNFNKLQFHTSNNTLYLHNLSKNSHIRIVDIQGRVLYNEKTNSGGNKEYSLSRGVYIIEYITPTYSSSIKFWVN